MVTFDSTDLDGAQEDSGTVHENVTNTDNTDASQLKKGYSNQPPALMNGLVGWWPLHDETAQDYSGGGNDGAVTGPTTGVTGRGGIQAMGFDGTDDYIDVGSSISWAFPFTISAWVKTPTGGVLQTIFSDYAGGQNQSAGPEFHQIVIRSGNYAQAQIRDANDIRVEADGTTTVTDGEWHLVTGVFTSTEVSIYVDATNEATASHSLGSDVDSGEPDWIGANEESGDHFDGTIADVRVYNRVLSASEIQTLYEWGSVDVSRPPDNNDGGISYYSFNSQNADDGWGSNNGTVSGATYLSSGGPRGDGAYSFDGTDDYISLPDQTAPSSITISAWVNWDGGGDDEIVGLGYDGNVNEGILNIDTNGNLRFQIFDGSSLIGVTGSSVPQDWVHVVGIYDNSASEYRVYQNGTLDSTQSSSSGPSSVDNPTAWSIGARRDDLDSDFEKFFAGIIDDVRIYDRALSPAEVHELYQYGTLGRDMREILVRA